LRIGNTIALQQWQSQWDCITNNKLKNIKKTIKKCCPPTNTARLVDIVTTRARIGHTRLTHSYLFNPQEEQPICHQCNEILSIEHITLHCPMFNEERKILSHPTNMEEAVGEVNVDAIFNFYRSINLINLL
jgi:hypothetical protein